MQNINFTSAKYKEYQFNGGKPVKINISDIGILSRIKNGDKRIEEITKAIGDEPSLEALEQADKEIRELIDQIFGAPVSDAAFGSANCVSPTEGGGFICSNFLEAFMPVVIDDISGAAQADQITLDQSALDNDKTKKYLDPPIISSSAAPSEGEKLTDEQKAFLKRLLGE